MKHYLKPIHIPFLFLTAFLLLLPCYPSNAATYYYNIKDFGADGTDKKSDSAAIQAALDMAPKNTKLSEDNLTVVKIPNGTYYITKALFIQSNTKLQLSKKAVIRRSDSSLGKNMMRTTNASHNSGKAGGYNLAKNITITGGTFDGGNIKKSKSACNLIYIGHSSNIVIQNTTIKNCYGAHAIEFAGVKDSVIRNCKITGFRYEDDYFTSEAIQLDTCYTSKKDGAWAPGFKPDKTACKNIRIEKNTITDYPRGIGVHHKLKGHLNSNITIKNNKFKRSSPSTQGKSVVGIFLLGVNKATISGNTFDHYSYGAMIKQSQKVTIKKNNFKYNSLSSLNIEGCDKNNGRHAFLVTSDKNGKKTLEFSCGMIKSGTVTTAGNSYTFHSSNGKVSLGLSKKIKANQLINFYGKDKYNNKYYRNYYVPKHKD